MTLLRNAVLLPDAARARLPRLTFDGADNQERHGKAAITAPTADMRVDLFASRTFGAMLARLPLGHDVLVGPTRNREALRPLLRITPSLRFCGDERIAAQRTGA